MVKFMEFWILDMNGIALYHQKASKDIISIDKNLISGFLAAFQSMVSVSAGENIEAIKFRDSKLTITLNKKYNMYFMTRTTQKEKDKKIRKEIDKLIEFFIEDFRSLLNGWDGDVNAFQGFENRVVNYL